jgi:hypothetical protein
VKKINDIFSKNFNHCKCFDFHYVWNVSNYFLRISLSFLHNNNAFRRVFLNPDEVLYIRFQRNFNFE